MAVFIAKNAGIAFMIVGAITLLGGILTIILPIADVEGYSDRDIAYFIILAIGEIIAGLLYFIYGRRANAGRITKQIDVLTQFVKVVGLTAIISGVFSTAASIYPDIDLGTFFAGAISSIIIGVILLVISILIKDGRKSILDKLLWTALLIAFLSLFLISLLEILAVDNVVAGAVGVLTYVFMVILLFEPEVELSMGIRTEENL
jgi:hypothetical protein